MAGPAGDDGRVRVCRARGPPGGRDRPAPVLLIAALTGILLAGCGSGDPAGGGAAAGGAAAAVRPAAGGGRTSGSATAGSAVTGQAGPGRVSSPGPGSASAAPGDTVPGVSNSVNNRPVTDAGPAAAPGSPAPGPGCSRWPAGSASTTLLITQASNGQQYCVHPGQAVQVYLGGTLSPRAGSEPPRLTGAGLAPSPSGQAHLLRSPAAAYQAVRAGRAVLTIVRQPCRSVAPAPTPAAGPQGTRRRRAGGRVRRRDQRERRGAGLHRRGAGRGAVRARAGLAGHHHRVLSLEALFFHTMPPFDHFEYGKLTLRNQETS